MYNEKIPNCSALYNLDKMGRRAMLIRWAMAVPKTKVEVSLISLLLKKEEIILYQLKDFCRNRCILSIKFSFYNAATSQKPHSDSLQSCLPFHDR